MPVPGENIQSWSTTALDNGTADSLIAWPEGQTRASVNNAARGMMAAVAKDRNLQNGSIVTTGTGNAQAFISGVGYTAVPTGLRVLLKIGPGLTNTGDCTLNMDGIGAVAVKYPDGNEIGADALKAGAYVEFLYDGTNWIVLTIPASTIINIMINQTTISTSTTTVEFLEGFDGTYDQLTILVTNLVPVNNAVELRLQMTTDGTTWKTALDDYRWVRDVVFDAVYPPVWSGDTSSGYPGGAVVGDQAIRMIGNHMSNLADRAVAGEVKIFAPHLASIDMVQWHFSLKDDLTFTDLYRGSGGYRLAGPVKGVRFLTSSGDFATAKFTMYGVKAT